MCTPLCSPKRETGTLKIDSSDMMCDVGNAAIKDATANIVRNREVLHFLSCIARFLGQFSGLPTIRPSETSSKKTSGPEQFQLARHLAAVRNEHLSRIGPVMPICYS